MALDQELIESMDRTLAEMRDIVLGFKALAAESDELMDDLRHNTAKERLLDDDS